MASAVDAAGNPFPTSAVLMSAAKHIGVWCHAENVEFLKCKKKDQKPEKCLDKDRVVTGLVLYYSYTKIRSHGLALLTSHWL